jgi:O-acetyl-ADP-ribose deacetylase (regulator of RNase III)
MAVPRIILGNIFDSPCQTITNPVNCAGIMGAGLALQFRNRFPEMHADYVARCQSGEVRLGCPYLFKRSELPWILNFPTKRFPRDKSDFLSIARGMDFVLEHYRDWGIASLAIPALGCGLGGLDLLQVGPGLYAGLRRLDIPTELYVATRSDFDLLCELIRASRLL